MRRLGIFILFASVITVWSQDQIRLLDGSRLLGQFLAYGTNGVSWDSPNAHEPFEMQPDSLHKIHLGQRYGNAPAGSYNARISFFNGDSLLGSVVSLDKESIIFNSWFAGEVRGPRELLKSITFFNHGGAILYVGPNAVEEWRASGPTPWRLENGFLHGGPQGFLSRDFKWPEKGRIQFEISWDGAFNTTMSFCSANRQAFSYSAAGYQLRLSMGFVNLYRGNALRGMTTLGNARTPIGTGLSAVEYEVRYDAERSVIALLMNGNLVQRWTDPAGFDSSNPGLSFINHSQAVRIGKIRVSEWDGTFAEDVAAVSTNIVAPVLSLVNNDHFSADLQKIADGKVILKSSDIALNIPVSRVNSITFPVPYFVDTNAPPKSLLAHLMSNERLTFDELNFERGEGPANNAPPVDVAGTGRTTGHSFLFGPVKLNSDWITELSFNTGKTPRPFVTAGVGPQGWFVLQ
ncbi:MAG: hypothetical protein ACPGVU_11510 [Limisphaerales bacterium]